MMSLEIHDKGTVQYDELPLHLAHTMTHHDPCSARRCPAYACPQLVCAYTYAFWAYLFFQFGQGHILSLTLVFWQIISRSPKSPASGWATHMFCCHMRARWQRPALKYPWKFADQSGYAGHVPVFLHGDVRRETGGENMHFYVTTYTRM
jgi:hypothetical protein